LRHLKLVMAKAMMIMVDFFSYYQPDELKNILEKTGYFSSMTLTVSADNMVRENNWVNVIAKKMN
jgi:hypothetical protein